MTSKLLKFWFHIALMLLTDTIPLIYADSNLQPFVQEILDREGISIEELKNNPELRKEWLKQLRVRRSEKILDEQRQALPESEFYGVIVTNNLFRPLGYRKPNPQRPFKLIATIVNPKTSKNRALIQSTKDQQFYYVTEGEQFANAELQRVEIRRVTLLYNGKSQDLRIAGVGFLNNVNRGGRRIWSQASATDYKRQSIWGEGESESHFNPDMRQTIEIDMKKVSLKERDEIMRKYEKTDSYLGAPDCSGIRYRGHHIQLSTAGQYRRSPS